MPILDLIITHYREPWDTCQKFFDMLCLQRGINASDVRIIIVQDGPDGAIDWKNTLYDFPYAVKVKTIPHQGVSAARNAGLALSDAAWVMFCDCDDTFTSTHSIRRFLEQTKHDYAVIASRLYNEAKTDTPGSYELDLFRDNSIFIHAKMFRREFLLQNNLRFEPGITYSEDTLFCHVLDICTRGKQTFLIPEPLYTRCFYDGSVSHNANNNFNNCRSTFLSRKRLAQEYAERGCPKNALGTIIKTIFDYYYAITGGTYPRPEFFEQDFLDYWRLHEHDFRKADKALIAFEKDISHHEAIHKGYIVLEQITFDDWVSSLQNKYLRKGATEQ